MRPRLVFILGAFLAAGFSAARAQTAYTLDAQQRWAAQAAEQADPDHARMAQVRRLIAKGEFGDAYDDIDEWIKEHEGSDSTALPEAYVLRATSLIGTDREFKALFDLEKVARRYESSPFFAIALEREFDVALMYLHGLNRRSFGFRIEPAYDIAEEIIIRINERLPGSRLAERALMELADYYYRERDLKMAATAYDCFVQLFPKSELRRKAMERRIYATIAQFKGPRYDASGLLEARYLVQGFKEQYAREAQAEGISDALEARLDESAAEQMLEVARWYLKRGNGPSARLTIARLIHRHPASSAAQEGLAIMQDKGWIKPPEDKDVASGPGPKAEASPASPRDAVAEPAK